MITTVPVEGKGVGDGYGLGIYETKLPNGVSVWGHGGSIPGFMTFCWWSNWRQAYICCQC